MNVLKHNVGVLGGEGEGGSDPDGGLPASAQMDPHLPRLLQEPVPQLNGGQVHGAERAASPHRGHKPGELALEAQETGHHDMTDHLDTVQQVFLLDRFHDLETKISSVEFVLYEAECTNMILYCSSPNPSSRRLVTFFAVLIPTIF